MNELASIVISNVFVATLIGCLAWLVGRSGHRAQLAHVLWVAFFVKLVTPPLISLPVDIPEEWVPAIAATAQRPAADSMSTVGLSTPMAHGAEYPQLTTGEIPQTNTSAEANDAEPSRINAGWFPIVVWGIGFLWIISRGTIRFVQLLRLLIREGKSDGEATEFVHGLIKDFDQNQAFVPRIFRSLPTVLRVPVRISPMLFGFAHRTVIVCPDLLWDSFTREERESFLAHETAHYCRRDHWLRWLEWTVSAAYWWFPAVYVARKQLERHEEACCDAWAVGQLRSAPRRYAEALLKAIDFISEEHAGIPRLASSMKHTEGLEERLRLVMRSQPHRNKSRLQWLSGILCLAMVLLHPVVRPYAHAASTERISSQEIDVEEITETETAASPASKTVPIDLPPKPVGFWNSIPDTQWADFELSLDGSRLVATAGSGIRLETPSGRTIAFEREEISSLVDITTINRVVIGSADGAVRLWDVADGLPVSLIGRHTAGVTSLAWHVDRGLVSADGSGAIMKWDLRSGEVLATASADNGVQSVRYSSNGNEIAVLNGLWNESVTPVVDVLQADTLEVIDSFSVPGGTAVVFSADNTWLTIDWSGVVRTLTTQFPIGSIEKAEVSALAFTQGRSADDNQASAESDETASTGSVSSRHESRDFQLE